MAFRTRLFNYLMIFAVFFLQAIENLTRQINSQLGIQSLLSTLKNALLLGVILLFSYQIYRFKRFRSFRSCIFIDELLCIFGLALVFAVLSIYFMLKNNGFHSITIIGIVRLLIPAVAAFAVLNVLSFNDIYKLMRQSLIITFLLYLCSIAGHISLESISTISFITSNSPFESHFFSPPAMAFCLFFCYYRKNKLLTFLSVFFTFLTFKRIMILYALFLLLFGSRIKQMKKLPGWLVAVFGVAFFALSMFYTKLMAGEMTDFLNTYFGISTAQFSMGRSYFMTLILEDFKSVGYMTSTVGYRSMEMDIPMVYTELGVLAVIAIVFFFVKIAKLNWYNFFIIVFCLLEILTSHWLDVVYFWIIAYITIGCIAYKDIPKAVPPAENLQVEARRKCIPAKGEEPG